MLALLVKKGKNQPKLVDLKRKIATIILLKPFSFGFVGQMTWERPQMLSDSLVREGWKFLGLNLILLETGANNLHVTWRV